MLASLIGYLDQVFQVSHYHTATSYIPGIYVQVVIYGFVVLGLLFLYVRRKPSKRILPALGLLAFALIVFVFVVEIVFAPPPVRGMKYGIQYHSKSRNLVMGLAENMPADAVRRFCGSLRKTGSDAEIVIFSSATPPDWVKTAHEFQVNIINFELPKNPFYFLSSYRYVLYKAYLEGTLDKSYEDYDAVFISDIRDAFFQREPFGMIKDYKIDGIGITLEGGKIGELSPSGNNKLGVNGLWISLCFGPSFLNSGPLPQQFISCSGTTVGTALGIYKYTSQMVAVTGHSPFCSAHGSDQGIHNVLAWLPNRHMPNVAVMGFQANSPILTFSGLPPHRLSFSESGQFLNALGHVVAVVHQFDRCKEYMVVPGSARNCSNWVLPIFRQPADFLLSNEEFFKTK